jgi:hypothetical protein
VAAAEEAPERTAASERTALTTEATATDRVPYLVCDVICVAAPVAAVMMMMTPTEPKTRCIKKHI